jgi:hypothetical protein
MVGLRRCQRAGESLCPTESTTGPMTKLPPGGNATVDRDTMCLVASNFRVRPDQRCEEIQLSSAHWWRLTTSAAPFVLQHDVRHKTLQSPLHSASRMPLKAQSL